MQLTFGFLTAALATVAATTGCGDVPSPTPTVTPTPTPTPTVTPTPTPSSTPFSLCRTLTTGKKLYLQADNEYFFGYCQGCNIPGYSLPTRVNKWAHPVTITTVATGRIAMQAETGRFLGRCEDCGPDTNSPDQIVQRGWSMDDATMWECEDVSDTVIALKDNKGKYMTHGAPQAGLDGDLVVSKPRDGSNAQHWTVIFMP
uniref:Secreted protein n=1 Tax=Achlya hypogyna TaxID=1202772 RepID=A0A0A7CN65_ACHHY|nr:secreted protein [Achlya hypogyna]